MTIGTYWESAYPIMLDALADQSPGMTPTDVAELLEETDHEILNSINGDECVDISDGAVVRHYLYENVIL